MDSEYKNSPLKSIALNISSLVLFIRDNQYSSCCLQTELQKLLYLSKMRREDQEGKALAANRNVRRG